MRIWRLSILVVHCFYSFVKCCFGFISDATGDTNLSSNACLITALNRVNTSCLAFIMHMESCLNDRLQHRIITRSNNRYVLIFGNFQ